ncbi:amino acid adenylation domain protein [Paenibacillus curdlanolyticus YK9]|uniref:Amino acid adenylation domain protein n=1 Tax=Paenibacillus curdlanolyticus YK9 TaxID=717606 RepID=E0I7S8_9BACL|nr:non-ribosomal peptide synthetase [Paenibacillus curdlanolyticus]EFM11233.1 amino acid adenylation domain protein [Paenibacillus curdlanolyticus YK9]
MTMVCATMNEALARAAQSEHGITFIDKREDVYLPYRRLYEEARSLLGQLQGRGMKAGDLLLFQIEEPELFLPFFWASLLGGIVPVPVTVGATPEQRAKVARIWELTERPFVIASSKVYPTLAECGFQEQLWDTGAFTAEEADHSPGIIHDAHSDDLAFIQYSSGSTGDPKGVMLTHRNLLTNIAAIVEGSKANADDRALSWMPLTHDMGLIGFHLTPLANGMSQWIMQPALFLLRPRLWLQKASDYRITQLASPNFGYKHVLNHLGSDSEIDWDLSSVKLLFNGAEPISAPLADEFLTRMAPYGLRREAMFPVYGMAEASLAITFPPVEEELLSVHVERQSISVGSAVQFSSESSDTTVTFADVGFPVSHCEVRICDESGSPLGEHRIGHIQIKGGNVTKGYYRNEAATQALITEDGWLDTGDIGLMRSGRLVITGRKKDIIFIGGRNYFPHDLEQLALEIDGIELGKIAVCGVANTASGTEELVAFVQFRGKEEAFAALVLSLTSHISLSIGLQLGCVIAVRQIPKTTSGKPQRYKLVEQYVSGEFREQEELYSRLIASRASMEGEQEEPWNETEQLLREIWLDVMERPISLAASFHDYGIDSLKASWLLSRVHQQFHVEISPKQLAANASIRALARKILQSEAGPAAVLINKAEQAGPGGHDPVTPTQKRMYVQQLLGDTGTAYNMPFAVKLTGPIDAERLERALQQLVNRHEALRTTYGMIDGEVRQTVHSNASLTLNKQSLDEAQLPKFLAQLIQPFDLHSLPLLRSTLIYVQSKQPYHILHLDIHHIACDGISANIMLVEWFQLYQGETLPVPELQYRDYAVWLHNKSKALADAGSHDSYGGDSIEAMHQQQREQQRRQAAASYWSERLQGEIPVLDLPTDYERPERRTYNGDLIRVQVPELLSSQLQAWMKREQISLHTVLLSAFSFILHKYARQEDLIIGALVAGRNDADLSKIVGAFIEYMPIRFRIDASTSWAQYVQHAEQEIEQDFAHQQLPYEEIAALTRHQAHPSRNPLFDTMVVLHNQSDFASKLASNEVTAAHYALPGGTAKLDLKLDVYLHGSAQWELAWEYNTDLFAEETVARLGNEFLRLLEQAVASPHTRLADLGLLSEEEQQQQLLAYNPTATPFSESRLLHEWVEMQAEAHPDRVAATFDHAAALTYGELNARANQLARELRRRGVKRDRIVPIMTERSPQMIAGILAILKAGGAYLPIAPELPEERIRYMLEDAGAELLLVQDGRFGSIPFAGTRLELDDESLYEGEAGNLPAAAKPDSLAYVIYTSGSTGNPKGVMIEHRSVINRIEWMQSAYPIGDSDVILQKTAFTFDVSVWELFWWAQAGASVHFLAPGGEKEPEAIVQAIAQRGITTMHFVPSMLQLMLAYLEARPEQAAALASLRLVFASGEALPLRQAERFNARLHAQHGTRLINLYGPTEATVDVSHFDCSTAGKLHAVPIGKPIANTQLYVVDAALRLCPPGVPGELCIGGAGLARGYWERLELTAERFVPNPFEAGTRMYRTGDLAKLRPDGQVIYMGRLDHQVKIRGFRMELGEIEHHLLQMEEVREAVVLAEPDADGELALHAYLVAVQPLDASALRAYLARRLPEYMVPAYFSQIERMPLSASGKADRHALAAMEATLLLGKTYVEPSTETQAKLAALWRDILHVERVGITDNFFELGGHSLKAVHLIEAVHRAFHVQLELREIFHTPTVQAMAEVIDHRAPMAFEPIPRVEKREHYPLSSAQSRLYILQQFQEIGTAYHLPVALQAEGLIDRERLRRAVASLIARHESLRTAFEQIDGVPVQKVHAHASVQLETYVAGDEATVADVFRTFVRPFDLAKAPLLRVGLLELPDETASSEILLFDMHHIVSDGVSMAVLVQDFTALYEGRELAALPVQYTDFAAWQLDRLASPSIQSQRQYWLSQFEDGAPVLQLPTDFKRPAMQSYEGDVSLFRLSDGETLALKQLALQSQTTLYMVILAMFNVLLSRYSGQSDVVVGSPVAGRPHADLRDSIGMFVQTLPLRHYPAAGKTFLHFLEEVKGNVLAAFEHAEYPFEELVGSLPLSRDTSRNPLFDVMFVMQNMDIPELALGGASMMRIDLPHRSAKFDLTLEVSEHEGGLACKFEYATALFMPKTIGRLIRHFRAIIAEVSARPEQRIGEIEILSARERERVLHTFNDTTRDYPVERPLHSWFEEQALQQPDRPALWFGDIELTYGELNARANRLARELAKDGLGPNRVAAVLTARSPEMIIAILAIVKAGGAYLPISPDDPEERIAYLLEDSGAMLLLARERWLPLAQSRGIAAISLERLDQLQGDESNLHTDVRADDLAYIIYTSGSTGNPKGVMIEHRAVVNRICWMQQRYPLGSDDVILQKTPYTFDVSVWELFWWSFAGAAVCLLEPGQEKDPEAIVSTIGRRRVTTMHFVPSMLHLFLDYVDRQLEIEPERTGAAASLSDKLASLNRVFASGEALPVPVMERFYALLLNRMDRSTRLINLYGPTEAAIDVSFYDCLPNGELDSVPIGRPIDNIQLYIVNEHDRLQPEGLQGELCIAGIGLARGYRNREELTAEKFVSNPFVPGTRMYRTGDLARWLPDGNIEYLGRLDHQVKLRGYRIELGEIEAALLKHESIAESAVLVKQAPQGDSRLCAYIVAKQDVSVADIRRHLGTMLPDYMIPASYTMLETMPLTASGKANRGMLAKLESNLSAQQQYAAPSNAVEEQLAQVWSELLNVERVGIHDQFFELGGHSLLLLRMHAKLEESFPGMLTVTDLFAYPTIEKLAAVIADRTGSASSSVSMRCIELPEDFFTNRSEGEEAGTTLRIQLEADLSEQLIRAGAASGDGVGPILLALYGYLFAQVTKNAEQAVHYGHAGDRILPVDVDLRQAEHFSPIVHTIASAIRQASAHEEGFDWKMAVKQPLQKPANGIAALFYHQDHFQSRDRLTDIFDLAVSYRIESRRVVLYCEHAAERLRKGKVKLLMQGYTKLIRWFAQLEESVSAVSGGGAQ